LSFITHVLPLSGITSLSNMWIFVLRFAAFYHYLELHHSQTAPGIPWPPAAFYHYLELHHSQTSNFNLNLRIY
ncbi:hypothetical protein, partial [Dialister invisus]|uniref:hypothetical protein n=1 Tax=Dialister invisus TaxID=218538 RepID=UPI002E75A4D3